MTTSLNGWMCPGKKLYAYTVFCTMYQLRQQGQRISKALVLECGQTGWVTMGRPPAGQPTIHVWFGTEPGLRQRTMVSATVRRITRDGILIHGVEEVPGPPYVYAQAWWCTFKDQPVPRAVTGEPLPPSREEKKESRRLRG